MISYIRSFSPHEHEKIFDVFNGFLPLKDLSHLVVSYGGIDEEEITGQIHKLLEQTNWSLGALKKKRYWNLFAQHVSVLRFPADYFNKQKYLPSLTRMEQVVTDIVRQQGVEHGQAISSTLRGGKLREVQFGVKFGESPKKFGFFSKQFAYDDALVVERFARFLPVDLEKIVIEHPITQAFFEKVILPLKHLKCLVAMKICPGFFKDQGFSDIPLCQKVKRFYIEGLPIGLKSCLAPDLADSNTDIEALVSRCRSLEEIVCGPSCNGKALAKMGSQITSLSLQSGVYFRVVDFSPLKSLQKLQIGEGFISLQLLTPFLPKGLRELHMPLIVMFRPSDIASLELFPQLTHLTLRGVISDGFMMQRLAQSNPSLEDLDLESCEIQPCEIKHIFSSFPNLKRVVLGDPLLYIPKEMDYAFAEFWDKRPAVNLVTRYCYS